MSKKGKHKSKGTNLRSERTDAKLKWRNKRKFKPSFRRRDGGRIRPAVKKCIKCKFRIVKFHHVYCNRCWQEINNKKEADK